MTDHDAGVTRLPPQPCPLCAKRLDAAGTFDGTDHAPGPGAWTVCSGCLQWLVYDATMRLRPVTDREWLALTDEDRVALTAQKERVRKAWA